MMPAPLETDATQLAQLPLPVAKLARRSQNAKSPRDRHDTAYFAFEVSVRIAVAAAMPSDARELARGSLGSWVAALKPNAHPLADDALLALHALFVDPNASGAIARKSTSARELLDALVQYRNQVIGHGSQRTESFYERAGERLANALDAAWRAGIFLPSGAKLLYVESIALDARSRARVRAFDLTGESPRLVPLELEPGRFQPRPRTLNVVRGEDWTELHPWCLYDEEQERVLCFNGLGRRAQYLDYASGAVLTGAELEAAHPGVTDELRSRLETSGSAVQRAGAVRAPDDANLVGDCQLLNEIGAGQASKVYLARQESLGRLVAVKLFSARALPEAEDLARFEREIDALARCEHPNVVKVLTRGRQRGVPWFAMEHIEGASLDRVYEHFEQTGELVDAVRSAATAVRTQSGTQTAVSVADTTMLRPMKNRWVELARFFAEAADGLHHMHKRGILHRDVRPSNLMATLHATRPVIMDLGFVALDGQTISAGLMGQPRKLSTERFQSPEMLQRDLVPVDARCDVYSLAAVLYEFCTLHPVFETNDPQLARKILHESPRDPCTLRPDLPKALGAILVKALKKNPDDRQASASELARELRRFADAPVEAVTPATSVPQPDGRRNSSARWIAVGVGVVVLGAVLYWFVLRG